MRKKSPVFCEKRAHRFDVLAALALAIIFHFLLLLSFKAQADPDAPPERPRGRSVLVDLTDDAKPGIAALRGYLRDYDPEMVLAGSNTLGFSAVKREPDIRGLLPPPLRLEEEPVEEPGLIGEVVIAQPLRPYKKPDLELITSLMSRSAPIPAVHIFPMVETSGGSVFALEFKDDAERAKISALTELESVIELDFSNKNSIPRVNVVKSCGDHELEKQLVAKMIGLDNIRKSRGQITITVRWREV